MRVLSIGEILWDVFPDKELLGGAPLNFSVNTQRLGDSVMLITAVGNDSRGRAARSAMTSFDLTTELVQVVDGLPTGVAVVSTSFDGEPHFEIPRPVAFDKIEISPKVLDAAARLRPDWLYFGTLVQTEPKVEGAVRNLARSLRGVRCFYDMNLRPGQWNWPLVERLCRLASVLKLNQEEAKTLSHLAGVAADAFSVEAFCELWAERYELETVCVTLGPAGCCIYREGSTYMVPGYSVAVQDTVGAGDAFAAAFLHGYHRSWPPMKTARFANALGSLVASRSGATPSWSIEEWLEVASSPPIDRTVANF
jgi:fructokinase